MGSQRGLNATATKSQQARNRVATTSRRRLTRSQRGRDWTRWPDSRNKATHGDNTVITKMRLRRGKTRRSRPRRDRVATGSRTKANELATRSPNCRHWVGARLPVVARSTNSVAGQTQTTVAKSPQARNRVALQLYEAKHMSRRGRDKVATKSPEGGNTVATG